MSRHSPSINITVAFGVGFLQAALEHGVKPAMISCTSGQIYWVYEYQYGFDRKRHFVDGAYYREIILSELTHAETIYIARPINHKWISDQLPRNWPELQDRETEIGFNGSYVGERDKILLVNKLVKSGALGAPKYHSIDLKEMEPHEPRGFFDYVFESMDLFDDAYQQATAQFQASG